MRLGYSMIGKVKHSLKI